MAEYKDRCGGTEEEKTACAENSYANNVASLTDASPWGRPRPEGAHDPASCMNYLLPDSWMMDPEDRTCRLRAPCLKLSDGDHEGAQSVYPLLVAAAEVAASLPVPPSLPAFDPLAAAARTELANLRRAEAGAPPEEKGGVRLQAMTMAQRRVEAYTLRPEVRELLEAAARSAAE
jgi:hypothetical protein